jgi:hypothetical protein
MLYTINRLRQLKPGEMLRFYRGTPFEAMSKQPPDYYAMMMQVRDEMNMLVQTGRISVDRHKSSQPPFEATYIAKGL